MRWNFVLIGLAVIIVIDARGIAKSNRGLHHGKKMLILLNKKV